VIRWNHHHALALCLSMMAAQTRSAFVARENRFPPIGSSPRACFSGSCSTRRKVTPIHELKRRMRFSICIVIALSAQPYAANMLRHGLRRSTPQEDSRSPLTLRGFGSPSGLVIKPREVAVSVSNNQRPPPRAPSLRRFVRQVRCQGGCGRNARIRSVAVELESETWRRRMGWWRWWRSRSLPTQRYAHPDSARRDTD